MAIVKDWIDLCKWKSFSYNIENTKWFQFQKRKNPINSSNCYCKKKKNYIKQGNKKKTKDK